MNPRCPYSVVRTIGHRPDRPLVRPLDWRNVSGGRSRQLLRNMEHTQAVHAFVAALARQADSLGWDLEQIDPPRRASGTDRPSEKGVEALPARAWGCAPSIPTPSASCTGARRPGPSSWSGSAGPCVPPQWLPGSPPMRPATMDTRLAPNLRYYSTRRPTDDHGVRGLREIAGEALTSYLGLSDTQISYG